VPQTFRVRTMPMRIKKDIGFVEDIPEDTLPTHSPNLQVQLQFYQCTKQLIFVIICNRNRNINRLNRLKYGNVKYGLSFSFMLNLFQHLVLRHFYIIKYKSLIVVQAILLGFNLGLLSNFKIFSF
jgi:hypothetical protein